MANKIYTKKGDGGNTKTFNGPISKADQLAVTLGTIDELNSWIGYCRSQIFNFQFSISNKFSIIQFDKQLKNIQTNLMTINSILAGAKAQRFKGTEVNKLEKLIDKLQAELPELKNFIYPVGYLQVARTVARRAERELVLLNASSLPADASHQAMQAGYRLAPSILKYINRLSDALFVLARYHNQQSGIKEEVWKDRR